jgi:putative NADH-flavin reductase
MVRRAFDDGHSVTAFVRSLGRVDQFRTSIRVEQGDLLDAAALVRVIGGHDTEV